MASCTENFTFVYINVTCRTQGSIFATSNETFWAPGFKDNLGSIKTKGIDCYTAFISCRHACSNHSGRTRNKWCICKYLPKILHLTIHKIKKSSGFLAFYSKTVVFVGRVWQFIIQNTQFYKRLTYSWNLKLSGSQSMLLSVESGVVK